MKKHLVLFFLVCCSGSVICCSFISDSFCKTINDNETENIVVRGMIIETMDNGAIFQRLETLKGEEDREFIPIWDNIEFDCNGMHKREAVMMGGLDNEVIISLELIDTIAQSYEVLGDYRVPEGLWWETHVLDVQQDSVYGFIYSPSGLPGPYDPVSIEELTNNIIEMGSCTPITSTEKEIKSKINVFPSITSTVLNIKTNLVDYSIQIYTIDGILVQNENSILNIDVSDLNAGMYFIRFRNKNEWIATKRFTKI